MATWLPTQSDTFAASVAIAPVTNWTSNHNLSNIGAFDRFFFQQSPYQPGGIYHQRSPVNFAGLSRTPTLQTVGARDRCVPPSQAVEYHNALEEAGVECELVTYPLEGHDIRGDSAYMDFCERTIGWFDRHLRAESR
jgi:dipeptidyl aminopeptidase/acylaminoacyl peptidase